MPKPGPRATYKYSENIETGNLLYLFRLNDRSRMPGDCHVRFCVRLRVKFLGATHPLCRSSAWASECRSVHLGFRLDTLYQF